MCCITVCLSVCVCEIARVFENRSIGEYWKVGVSRTRERESLRINKKLNSVYVRACVRCVCVHGMCVCVKCVCACEMCLCVCLRVRCVCVCVLCVRCVCECATEHKAKQEMRLGRVVSKGSQWNERFPFHKENRSRKGNGFQRSICNHFNTER